MGNIATLTLDNSDFLSVPSHGNKTFCSVKRAGILKTSWVYIHTGTYIYWQLATLRWLLAIQSHFTISYNSLSVLLVSWRRTIWLTLKCFSTWIDRKIPPPGNVNLNLKLLPTVLCLILQGLDPIHVVKVTINLLRKLFKWTIWILTRGLTGVFCYAIGNVVVLSPTPSCPSQTSSMPATSNGNDVYTFLNCEAQPQEYLWAGKNESQQEGEMG